MCGRYVITRSVGDLLQLFDVRDSGLDVEFAPDYNVAPTRSVPIVWQDEQRRLELARWGLIPTWAKDVGFGARTFNARIESAAEKPSFRGAFTKRRALVPADGYYEWKKLGGGAKPAKQPYYIHPADDSVIALAGLHEWWRAAGEQDWVHSFSIITGPAAGELAEIHDRMPLPVAPDRQDAWLDPQLSDPEQIRGLLDVGIAPGWVARPVGAAVGNVRNNGPELLGSAE